MNKKDVCMQASYKKGYVHPNNNLLTKIDDIKRRLLKVRIDP